jgi:tetratricopeptide (TPR) repeat protein
LAAVRAKKIPRALVLAQRLAELSPENATHLVMVAEYLKTLGRHQEAIPYLEKAITAQPAGVQSRKILVECLVRTHQSDRAKTEFETLARLNRSGEGDLRRWFWRIQSETR